MNNWTEELFEQVVKNTKLTPDTRAACREVLVLGVQNIDAAANHGKLPSAVSRAVSTLRSKEAEVLKRIDCIKDSQETLKSSVILEARLLVGNDMVAGEAKEGGNYSGMVVAANMAYAVQICGIRGVIHDVGKLQKVPSVGYKVNIVYEEPGQLAKVEEIKEIALENYKGPDRRSR